MIKSDKILLRSGTAASWSATNPKLELGEIGYEIDTRKIKVGDGEYKWNGLSYIYTGDANAAGTSGQVQFNNGGLLGTNANFFWDNAQSFLGVGTATPTSKLTVRGGAITVGNTDAQVTQLAADGSNVGYVGTTTNTPFAIRTNGSNNRVWVTETGDVGIGNISPSQRLHVSGGNLRLEKSDNPIFEIHRGATRQGYLWSFGGSYLELAADSRPLYLTTGGANPIYFAAGGTEKARLTSTGNLGIGVTSPTYKLDVLNNIRLDTQGTGGALRFESYGNNAGQIETPYVDSQYATLAIRGTNNVLFYTGGNESARITSNGNIGIGSTAPAYKLYAEVNSNTPGNLTVGLGIRNINAGNSADTRLYFGNDISASAGTILTYSSNHSSLPNALSIVNNVSGTTSILTFHTNASTERMRIDSSGNVGIGVTSPSEKLHVADSMMFAQGTTALACKSYIINRSVSATAGDTTEIGSFAFTNGAGYIELDIVSHVGAYSISAKYLLPIQYANDEQAQNNVWLLALPVSYSGNYNSNQVNLDINVNNGVATLRLRRVSGAQIGVHAINIKTVGNSVTFTPSTTTATGVSTPTLIYGATALIQRTNKVGINTFSPGSTLDVKGTLRLSGATSGYVGLAPASAAGSTTYTLPSADGTSGQFLRTNGSGTLSWGAAGSATIYSPTTTTTITELSGEVVVLADATSGSLTVNLPTAVSNTAKITVKKIDSSANTVVIDGNSTQTIDGSLTKTIEFQYTSVTLISNGSNWFII